MSYDALHALAEMKGVLPVFYDLQGRERRTSDDSSRALLRAMGIKADTEVDARAALQAHYDTESQQIIPPEYVVTAGYASSVPVRRPCEWQLTTETGKEIASARADHVVELPALDVGVYLLHIRAGQNEQTTFVPAAPAVAPSVPDLTGRDRIWGVTAALYGFCSDRNLGLGDYADLSTLAKTLAGQGASFLGINPIHSLGWAKPDTISPYSPSHRGFLNPSHIACDTIPGLQDHLEVAQLVIAARCAVVRDTDLLDYTAFFALQRPLLQKLYKLFCNAAVGDAMARFRLFKQSGGKELHRFAIYEALSMQHGPNWHSWPEALKAPSGLPGDACDPAEVDFHMWLQWVAYEQLDGAARDSALPLGLYLDLAVGPRRDGAEAWMTQDSIAKGVSLGAPPDELGPEGQNWQLTAFAPGLSAATGYRNFRNVLRQTMRHAGCLRIDHILGLNRSFWIPDDGSPGAYVRQPFETLLALVGIEAHFAGCAVIGEDLGLVPEGFREQLADRGIYGYSVLQYEREPGGEFRDPDTLRSQSLACFATHDTPTLLGFIKGRDIDWWERLGLINGETATHLTQRRLCEGASLVPNEQAPADHVHQKLARSPTAMVAVQLDDILGEEEAQNLPGTIDEHPNWQRRASVPIENMKSATALSELAKMMRTNGRANPDPEKGDQT